MSAKKTTRKKPPALPAPLPVPAAKNVRKLEPADDDDELPALRPLPIEPPPAKKPPPAKEELGIPCRRCGCTHHWTIDVRRTFGGRVRRRRECRSCGHQFVTFER